MADYLSDLSRKHWMVSNPKRLNRTGMDGKSFRCPFCPGNEEDTPPEVYRVGEGEANKSGWEVRVVPNLFPITDIHEVVIHSTSHDTNIEGLALPQLEKIIRTYINRFNFHKHEGKVYIFSNQSLSSGASLIHSHSQISVLPQEIPTDTISSQPVENIIEQNNSFVSYCPTYSEWSYEVWIKALGQNKFESLNETEVKDLAAILHLMINKLKKIHGSSPRFSKKEFGYNFYVYPYDSWYLRIIPRFMERAGFELSTGIMVNSVTAEKASQELRDITADLHPVL